MSLRRWFTIARWQRAAVLPNDTWGICTRRVIIIIIIIIILYKASFSSVSKPNFATKCALESSRWDLHNALLCTVLNAQFFLQKSLNFFPPTFSPNFAEFDKFSLDFSQILPDFCRIFPIMPRRNVRGPHRVPTGYPEAPRSLHFRGFGIPYRASLPS